MRRSVNEFSAVINKAGSASGLPPDLAADTARAAALLSAHGHNGIAIAIHALQSGMDAPPPQREGEDITYPRTHAIGAGMAAAEVLCARYCLGKPIGARFSDIDCPLLLAAFFALAATDYQLHYALTFTAAAPQPPRTLAIPAADGDLLGDDLAQVATLQATARVKGRGEAVLHLPPQGLEVDAADWQRAERLAMQTYVAASEDSRRAGAGAGGIDND